MHDSQNSHSFANDKKRNDAVNLQTEHSLLFYPGGKLSVIA